MADRKHCSPEERGGAYDLSHSLKREFNGGRFNISCKKNSYMANILCINMVMDQVNETL